MNISRVLGTACALLLLCGAFSPLHAAWARDTSKPMPELFKAIDKGDLAWARAAIESGGDVNAVYDRETMLCWALRGREPEIVRLLLQSPRLDVNKRSLSYDDFGEWERTPLILAAHMGQAEMVAQLLLRGARPNARDRTDNVPEARGDTALLKAARRDHTEVIRVLLAQARGIEVDAQAADGRTPLWFVVEREDLEAVKLLCGRGAKINHPDNAGSSLLGATLLHKKYEVLDYLVVGGADINMVNNGGGTPLMEALAPLGGKNAKVVFRFLEKFLTFKPRLDLQQVRANGGGDTALHLAARYGYVDAVRLLLDNGASINIKSLATGGTPLHAAASAGRIDAAKHLIKRGANLDIFDKSGATPLLLAVYQADADMVEVLVDSGAAVNVKSPVDPLATPLAHAAGNPDYTRHKANLAIVKHLLKKGDVDFPSANGTTALMAAARKSDQSGGYELAALLVGRGAKLDAVNDKGETALMLAAGAGNEKLVKLLLDKGADAQKKNGAGETVMSYASRSGNRGNVSVLESKGVKPEAPLVRKSVVVEALVGTWKGFHDGLPQALYTVVLNRNGTFDFNSRFTPEALRQFPAGSVKPVIAAQKGTYSINNDTMIWDLVGAPPTSMKWRLEKGMLIIDNKIRLKKVQ